MLTNFALFFGIFIISHKWRKYKYTSITNLILEYMKPHAIQVIVSKWVSYSSPYDIEFTTHKEILP